MAEEKNFAARNKDKASKACSRKVSKRAWQTARMLIFKFLDNAAAVSDVRFETFD